MTPELRRNSIDNLMMTLELLGSIEKQKALADQVPFVCVPSELVAQWDGHWRLVTTQAWFRGLFRETDFRLLEAVEAAVVTFVSNWDGEAPAEEPWGELCSAAQVAYVALGAVRDTT